MKHGNKKNNNKSIKKNEVITEMTQYSKQKLKQQFQKLKLILKLILCFPFFMCSVILLKFLNSTVDVFVKIKTSML